MPDPRETIARKIKEKGPFSQDLLDGLRELSLPLQLAFLRRYYKITQGELAAVLNIKQAYLSRLEDEPSRHLLSHYVRVAEALGARIAMLPPGAKVILARREKSAS